MDDPDLTSEVDLHTQEILLAASQHDITTLRHLLRTYTFADCNAVDVQDSETGFSPLHAAIAACDTEEESAETPSSAMTNGDTATPDGYTADSNGMRPQEELLQGAKETIKCLQQNGAIWNQLDSNNETPGCIALRLGLTELYEMMVDAGVRAEMLLNRLEEYERLEDGEEAEGSAAQQDATEDDSNNGDLITANDLSQDTSSGHVTTHLTNTTTEVNSAQYLSSSLSLSRDRILDDQQNGVMMSWESDIMARSASAILTEPGLTILNIGFGMGIIDTHIQAHTNKPASHHIIEAHPTVLAAMRTQGWHEKPGVVIHEGKWQDIIPQLANHGQMFDGIYFDTFAESYAEFRDFCSEHVIALLEQSGRWSYFNGMGADRQISYDVYQKVVEMDLFEAGFDVNWHEIEVPAVDWEGVRRSYWNVAKYRLPVVRFMD